MDQEKAFTPTPHPSLSHRREPEESEVWGEVGWRFARSFVQGRRSATGRRGVRRVLSDHGAPRVRRPRRPCGF